MNGDKRQYVITKLPKYLIVHIKRFSQNTQHFAEKVQREQAAAAAKTAAHTSPISFLFAEIALSLSRALCHRTLPSSTSLSRT